MVHILNYVYRVDGKVYSIFSHKMVNQSLNFN